MRLIIDEEVNAHDFWGYIWAYDKTGDYEIDSVLLILNKSSIGEVMEVEDRAWNKFKEFAEKYIPGWEEKPILELD